MYEIKPTITANRYFHDFLTYMEAMSAKTFIFYHFRTIKDTILLNYV